MSIRDFRNIISANIAIVCFVLLTGCRITCHKHAGRSTFSHLSTLWTFLVALLLAKELTSIDLVCVFVFELGASNGLWVLLFTFWALGPSAEITSEFFELLRVKDFAEIIAFRTWAVDDFLIWTKSLCDGLLKCFPLVNQELLSELIVNESRNHVLTQLFWAVWTPNFTLALIDFILQICLDAF